MEATKLLKPLVKRDKKRAESPGDRLRPVDCSFSYDISPARSASLSRCPSREPSILRLPLRFDRRHGPFSVLRGPKGSLPCLRRQRPKRLYVIRQSLTNGMHLK